METCNTCGKRMVLLLFSKVCEDKNCGKGVNTRTGYVKYHRTSWKLYYFARDGSHYNINTPTSITRKDIIWKDDWPYNKQTGSKLLPWIVKLIKLAMEVGPEVTELSEPIVPI